MEYNPDEFVALSAEVERQGGALLPDKCLGQLLTYVIQERENKVYTCQCRNNTMFISTYEPTIASEKKGSLDRGGGFVRACAVCDSMGKWPRYEKAVEEGNVE